MSTRAHTVHAGAHRSGRGGIAGTVVDHRGPVVDDEYRPVAMISELDLLQQPATASSRLSDHSSCGTSWRACRGHDGFAEILRGCATLLRPGGTVVVTADTNKLAVQHVEAPRAPETVEQPEVVHAAPEEVPHTGPTARTAARASSATTHSPRLPHREPGRSWAAGRPRAGARDGDVQRSAGRGGPGYLSPRMS